MIMGVFSFKPVHAQTVGTNSRQANLIQLIAVLQELLKVLQAQLALSVQKDAQQPQIGQTNTQPSEPIITPPVANQDATTTPVCVLTDEQHATITTHSNGRITQKEYDSIPAQYQSLRDGMNSVSLFGWYKQTFGLITPTCQ